MITETEYQQRRKELSIARHGQCPHYKGHFDFQSFLAGVLVTAMIVSFIFGYISK